MTREDSACLRELQEASQQYEYLLKRKQALHAIMDDLLDRHPPGWQLLLGFAGRRLLQIKQSLAFLRATYDDALLVNQHTPLWLE